MKEIQMEEQKERKKQTNEINKEGMKAVRKKN